MNEILQLFAKILHKVKPVGTREIDDVTLQEMESVNLEARGEIEFEATMGLTKKNQKYVIRYEIERIK